MRRKAMGLRKLMLMLLLVGMAKRVEPVIAGEYEWVATPEGAFHDPQSWLPTGPPGSTDVAIFNQQSPCSASIEHSSTIHKQLRVEAGDVTFLMGVPSSDLYEPATYTLLGAEGMMRIAATIGTLAGKQAELHITDHAWHGTPPAYVDAEGTLILGQVAGSTGTLMVGDGSDQQATWTSAYPTIIGFNGTGELKIYKNDELIDSSAILGMSNGSEGTATVFGMGRWTNNGPLTIGGSGTGTLNVYDDVTNTGDAYIAKEPGSVGTVNVEPDGGFMWHGEGWTCDGSLYVGGDDQGPGGTGTLLLAEASRVDIGENLTVWSGGSITVESGFIEATDVDIRDGGTVDLTGPEDTIGGDLGCANMNVWHGGTVSVNSGGDVDCESVHNLGTIDIDGGMVSATGPITGLSSGEINLSDGILSVGSLAGYEGSWNWTGGGIEITNGSLSIDIGEPFGGDLPLAAGKSLSVSHNLRVGPHSNGNISVTDGVTVTCGKAIIGSLHADSLQASAVLDGTGANWTIGGDLEVRGAVSSNLSILSGATVSNHDAYVAAEPGTNALVILYGILDSALWDCAGDLYAGGDESSSQGTSTIQVKTNSQLVVGGKMKVWDDSVLEINGGSVDTHTLEVAGEVLVTDSGVLDVSGGMLDINNGGLLDGAIMGDSYTEVILRDNETSWSMDGSLVIAAHDAGAGHVGALTVEDGAEVIVQEDVTVLHGQRLALIGGTISAEGIDMLDQDFNGYGTIRGGFVTCGSVTAGGTLAIGDVNSNGTLQIGGALDAGQHHVTLNKQGTLSVGGPVSIAGGTLVVPHGIAVGTGNSIEGHGTIQARIAAQIGSTIQAEGDLSLGDSGSPAGFITDGDLVVNDNTVTVEDSNGADLGGMTWLGQASAPGTLVASNGLVLAGSDNVQGFGAIDTPDDPMAALLNDGSIVGNSASERIELAGFVKGMGSLDNVTILGTDSPGYSGPVAVYRGSVDYAGALVIEIGGLYAGSAYDQINHSGAAGLGGELRVETINGFEPGVGDSFTIMTYTGHAGEFDTLSLPALETGLSWQVEYGTSEVTLSVTERIVGDCDMDGDVDLDDYEDFADCLAGPEGGVLSGCECYDLDSSGSVDLADYALFQGVFTGTQ